MKSILSSYQKSLENLVSANKQIREIESLILKLSKDKEEDTVDMTKRISMLIDEVQTILEDVDLRVNQLDVQLSGIERLISSHE